MGQYFSNDCQEIVPGLFIGHLGCATDPINLKNHKITRIVDVSRRPYVPPPGVVVLRIPIPDVADYDIRKILRTTNNFIEQSLKQGHCVLVHCWWGISRSASVVIAYLMAKYRINYDSAFELVKRKRSVVQPNAGFVRFLKLYQDELLIIS